jgi:20S proteasome alpha/beta subunit
MKPSSSLTRILLLLLLNVEKSAGNSLFMGLVGRDFVLLAADTFVTQSWQIQTVQDPIRVHRNMAFVSSSQRLLNIVETHAIAEEYNQMDSVGSDVTIVDATTGLIQQQSPPSLQVEGMAQFLRQCLIRQDIETGCLVAGMTERNQHDESTNDDESFSCHVVQSQLSQVLTTADRLLPPLLDASFATSNQPVAVDNTKEPLYQPCLYWLDAHGSLLNVRYAAIGYASSWMWAWIDQKYRPDMTLTEAISLLTEGWRTLQASRSFLQSKLCLKYMDAEGEWHVVDEKSVEGTFTTQ